MNWCVQTTFIFSILFVTIKGENKVCGSESECITLESCQKLNENLNTAGGLTLISLVRKLHCGFDEEDKTKSKICCPPVFKSSDPAANLLPDISVCGIHNSDRIVGGEGTDIDEHPWMALLNYKSPKGNGFYCGGVLISSRYVLTAAHCVAGADIPANLKLHQVRFGEWNLTSEIDCNRVECAPAVVDVDIEEAIPHKEYNPNDPNQLNDIALLRLKKEVVFTDFVKPICLPNSAALRDSTFQGSYMEVAGWGKTEKRISSDVKLKVLLPVLEQNICRETYKKAGKVIIDKQLCAGGSKGQDSCRGDSGGPLMGKMPTLQNWMVTGVVSYGPSPCGTLGWPGVYTRVTSYLEWIISNVKP